jgi:8-oxo-dGTP diphosphatase
MTRSTPQLAVVALAVPTSTADGFSAAPTGAPRHEMPFTRLEVAVLGLVDGSLHALLARRAGEPYKGRWALPGGVLRIDLDASLDHAAQRVAQERLGCSLPFLRQLCAVGGPGRDKMRSPWALSVVYRALVDAAQLDVSAGKRVEALAWRPVDEAVADTHIAFDHASLIARAVAATREEVRALDLPGGFIPATFTLGELQALCEQMLGERLDKSSFRRRVADRDLVEPVEGEMRTGANRPAQVFRLK